MSPNLRRAAHQALDILLDAIADELKGEPTKRKRAPSRPEIPKIEITPEERAAALKSFEKDGWKRAG